jgi:hypothetical protein
LQEKKIEDKKAAALSSLNCNSSSSDMQDRLNLYFSLAKKKKKKKGVEKQKILNVREDQKRFSASPTPDAFLFSSCSSATPKAFL